ncbi:MAG: ATP-binding protein, partial [Pirellula sp.]|nr:ATP-binding protein [Pirellula sp.]
PSAESLYLPLSTPDNVAGVLAIQPSRSRQQLSIDARQLLETFATQVALAIERINLLERSNKAEIEYASEKMRSSLLGAVSHDIRTPLAAIAGAASILQLQKRNGPTEPMSHELLETIVDESQRLNQMVENLLNMTRLSSGQIQINRQWQPVEEAVGSALQRLRHVLVDREVKLSYEHEMLMIHADDVLLQTLLVNLIDNAVKYSPAKSAIEIHGIATSNGVTIEVADLGGGIRSNEERRLFEMFVRGTDRFSDSRGTGLGLAICKAIVDAHNGSISLRNREGGGVIASFIIPHGASLPDIALKGETS